MAPTHSWREFATRVLEDFAALKRDGVTQSRSLAVLEEQVAALRKDLMGNGQRGRIPELQAVVEQSGRWQSGAGERLKDAEGRLTNYGRRIGTLENWRWFLGGAIAVLTPLVAWALGAALRLFGS